MEAKKSERVSGVAKFVSIMVEQVLPPLPPTPITMHRPCMAIRLLLFSMMINSGTNACCVDFLLPVTVDRAVTSLTWGETRRASTHASHNLMVRDA